MAVKMDPIALAKADAQRFGGGNRSRSSFFSLKDGETKGLRFLNSIADMVVVSHACGLSHVEFKQDDFDAAQAQGGMSCPTCGQPITQSDVEYVRPRIQSMYIHRYFKTSDPQRHANFVCLANDFNASEEIVPANPDGSPKYACPVCSTPENMNKQGNPKPPTMRIMAAAVERDIKVDMVPGDNGIPVPTVTSVTDVMETDEDGNMRPKIVVVDMGYQSFWSKLVEIDPTYSTSICYYDWMITRTGSGLETTYSVQCATGLNNPQPISMDAYKDYLPDLKRIASSQGNPEHFQKNGYPVAGYIPTAANSAASNAQNQLNQLQQEVQQNSQQPMGQNPASFGYQQASPMQQYAQGAYEQPYPSQQGQPGAQNGWNAIQNAVGQQNGTL